MTIGDRIRKIRESLGWSQAELGRRTGMTAQAISNLELGKAKNPSGYNLARLATALDVSPERLLGQAARATIELPDLNEEEAEVLDLYYRQQQPDKLAMWRMFGLLPAHDQQAVATIIQTLLIGESATPQAPPPPRRRVPVREPAGNRPPRFLGGEPAPPPIDDADTRFVPVMGPSLADPDD